MQLRDTLLTLLAEAGVSLDAGADDRQPLDLESLEVVLLHDALEQRLGIRIHATEVTPDTFGSLASLEALVAAKQAEARA